LSISSVRTRQTTTHSDEATELADEYLAALTVAHVPPDDADRALDDADSTRPAALAGLWAHELAELTVAEPEPERSFPRPDTAEPEQLTATEPEPERTFPRPDTAEPEQLTATEPEPVRPFPGPGTAGAEQLTATEPEPVPGPWSAECLPRGGTGCGRGVRSGRGAG
jgi:hypothetical protein